ncbi:MAG: helix-turn-helix transcriptional regulator [Caldilineaceae bacterium]|nr:helix-turn-helix transcriptional regulator [Caldilineaceae bacterium]
MAENKNLARLGEIIKAKRQEAGLGLRAAAEESGISASTLSRLERGIGAAPDAETMTKLSEWLEASVDDLLFGGEAKFKELEALSTPDIIEVHLRADKNLSDETAKALADLFRAAYRQLAREDTGEER